MPPKFEFIYRDQVRYSDCDMHQHMNHAVYFSFFEQARVVYCEQLGFKATADYHSIPFIIAAAHCEYKAPALLNDHLVIHLGTTHIGTKSFRIDYEMRQAETKALIATAYTVQVMFDYKKMKSILVPKNLKEKMTTLKKVSQV